MSYLGHYGPAIVPVNTKQCVTCYTFTYVHKRHLLFCYNGTMQHAAKGNDLGCVREQVWAKSGNALMKVVYWQKSNFYDVSSSYVLGNAMHSVTSAFKHMSHFNLSHVRCNMLHVNVAKLQRCMSHVIYYMLEMQI